MSERTAVCRLCDADDVLLYVGVSKTFGRRWTQHAAAKPWWPEVRRQTIDWHPDRATAFKAETEAIECEKPQHNVVHTPRQYRQARPVVMVKGLGAYVGAAEIGRMLGVSRQRVQQLVSRPDFPRPEVVLEMGKVWRRGDIERWARAHGRLGEDDAPES